MTQYRASFDATVTFANGGVLTARGFRVDVPSASTGEAGIAALFVASLGLLMTESVELTHVEIVAEPHKGTRGGPSDRSSGPTSRDGTLVELSHVIRAGMITYPGLPGPEITPHLTRKPRGAATPPVPSSRSAGSAWWATPGRTSTRPITAIPGAPTWPRCRWNGPPTCPPWWSG